MRDAVPGTFSFWVHASWEQLCTNEESCHFFFCTVCLFTERFAPHDHLATLQGSHKKPNHPTYSTENRKPNPGMSFIPYASPEVHRIRQGTNFTTQGKFLEHDVLGRLGSGAGVLGVSSIQILEGPTPNSLGFFFFRGGGVTTWFGVSPPSPRSPPPLQIEFSVVPSPAPTRKISEASGRLCSNSACVFHTPLAVSASV